MWSKGDWKKIKRFRVVTEAVVYRCYYVNAEDEEDAGIKWGSGERDLDSEDTDSEEIIEISED